jgi:hypothetical protein
LGESEAIASGAVSEFEALQLQSAEGRPARIDAFSFALLLLEILVGLPTVRKTDASEELGSIL